MIYEITVPQFSKMLRNLSAVLAKGAGKPIPAPCKSESTCTVTVFGTGVSLEAVLSIVGSGATRTIARQSTVPVSAILDGTFNACANAGADVCACT